MRLQRRGSRVAFMEVSMKRTLLAAAVLLATAGVSTAQNFVQTQGRPPHDRGRDAGVGAVLYSNSDFRGDRYVVQGDYMRDLANTGFNDRAQSLRVERGYWIFCSDAEFRGQCRTFGPGDYRQLPHALENRISSGRRISDRYPYNGRPNWGDR
jgi:hypothetical protein